jgi:SOS-response transcriptional repressor LexA
MDAKFIRDRFIELAKLRKFSRRWLSDSLHINRYSVDKIIDEGDVRNGRDEDRLRQIIEKLGFTQEWFFKDAKLPGKEHADKDMIPVYGDIPAGNPTWFDGRAEPEAWVQPPPGTTNKRLFALRVRGDSMAPRYLTNDLLYLEPLSIRLGIKDPDRPAPRLTFERINGRVVAALVDGEATLKKLSIKPLGKRDDYELHLLPLNPDYSPVVIGPHQTAWFQGVVVGLYRNEA